MRADPGETDGSAECTRVRSRGDLAAHVSEISTEADRARWEPMLFDLVSCNLHGVGEKRVDVTELYPHVGVLRERLREALALPKWQEKDHRGLSVGRVARSLLAFWSDPRDEDEIERWLEVSKRYASRPRTEHVGPTAEAAAQSWSRAHFEREMKDSGLKTPPPHSIRVVAAPGDQRALIEHVVHYAHWGYSHYLVLVRADDGYRVRIVLEHEHWHMD